MVKYIIISTLIHLLVISTIFSTTYILPHSSGQNKFNSEIKVSIISKKGPSNLGYQKPEVKTKNTLLEEIKKNDESENQISLTYKKESPITFKNQNDGNESNYTNPQENSKEFQSSSDESIISPFQSSSDGNIIPPKILYSPPLNYPLLAKLRNIQGRVVIGITIATNGKIRKTWIIESSGYDILDLPAIEYANKLIFEPAKTPEGTPTEITITYVIHFILK